MTASKEHVIPVNSLNFDQEVTEATVPVLVDISAPWCAPCRTAAPVVAELAREHHGRLKVVEIDGDQSPELVARLNVRGFPSFLGYFHGELVQRVAGFAGKSALQAFASKLLRAEAPVEPQVKTG